MSENDDKSRISIKLGSLELEFEGSEKFLENHLPNLVELLASINPSGLESEAEEESELLEEKQNDGPKKLHMSTSTIANKLGAKSGRDLVIAAAAHFT